MLFHVKPPCACKMLFDLQIRGQDCAVVTGVVLGTRILPTSPQMETTRPVTSCETLCHVSLFPHLQNGDYHK